MSATILARTIGGIQDNRIQMRGSSVFRGFSVPQSWTTLRVGIRFTFDGTATTAGVNNTFEMGFSHGTTAATNSINWLHDYEGRAFNAASGGNAAYYSPIVNLDYLSTNASLGSAVGGSTVDIPATGSSATRRMMFLDITKGSPNYSGTLFFPNGATSNSVDALASDFTKQLVSISPVFSGHTSKALTAIAFSEATYPLDTAFIYWSTSTTVVNLEICDIGVAKIA